MFQLQSLFPQYMVDWEQGQFQCKVGWELVQLHYRRVDGFQLQLVTDLRRAGCKTEKG